MPAVKAKGHLTEVPLTPSIDLGAQYEKST